MIDLSSKSALVIDNGLFIEFAIRISKDFGKVYYTSPWRNGFPRRLNTQVGSGIEGITRVDNERDYIDKVDIIIFPDIYYSDWQEELRARGKRVWGLGGAEYLESDRWKTKYIMETLGMPVPESYLITGLDALKSFLKENEDYWVKVSKYRGEMETFHSPKYFIVEPKINELEMTLGDMKKDQEFIVEKSINDAVELGYDGWTIDGYYPSVGMWGYEIKDMGYIGKIGDYSTFPEQIRYVNEKISPIFNEEGSRGFFSTEIRVQRDGVPYLIDPCARLGSPPSEVEMLVYSNFSECIWEGANGNIVTPKPVAKYSVMAMIHSSYADGHWVNLKFPPKYRDNIKFRNLTIRDGIHYVVPVNTGLPEIGAVVAVDDTVEGAIKKVNEISETIEAYDIDIKSKFLDDALDVIDKGEEYGIQFFDEAKRNAA